MEYFSASDVTSYFYVSGVNCSTLYSLLGDLSLQVDEVLMRIPSESYLEDFKFDYYGDVAQQCRFMVEPSNRNEVNNVLGTVFIENYNFTYDLQSRRVHL